MSFGHSPRIKPEYLLAQANACNYCYFNFHAESFKIIVTVFVGCGNARDGCQGQTVNKLSMEVTKKQANCEFGSILYQDAPFSNG